tara:strand:+ start:199 stop:315 length:117 start_codon:yes stop_codon:yes gene_type:complete
MASGVAVNLCALVETSLEQEYHVRHEHDRRHYNRDQQK